MLLRAVLLIASAFTTSARHARPRLLLYTPLHVSESTEAVRSFAACLFGKKPSLNGHKFDVLISVSGAASDGRNADFHNIVANASGAVNVTVRFTTLHDDTYALSLSNDHRKGQQWVSGPNDAFYGAMLRGSVHDAHVRYYDLVQQVETDVCAMADGWLDVLVEPMLRDASLLISGASTACDCVYDSIHDVCEPMSKHGDHLRAHVNGNAMYRVGRDLGDVLAKAQATYGNNEPFDLAVYWTMKDAGMLSRLHINPRYLNTPCLVDRVRFTSPAYHAIPDAVAVHAPRRLRTTSIQAVASRGLNRDKQTQRKLLTLTVVAVTSVDVDVSKRQRAAFAHQFVEEVVYVAADRTTFDAVSKIAPLQVVAAFDGDGGGGQLVESTINHPTNHHTPLPALESWPPSTTVAGALLTAVARMLTLGHDVFLVGVDAVPLANYGGKLAGLDRGSVHVAGFDADSLPSMAYLPATDAVAAFVDVWAAALRRGQSTTYETLVATAHHHAVTLTHLPWSDFVVGGPLLASGWPGGALKRRAIVAVGGGDAVHTAFRLRAARLWPKDARIPCANYSVLSRRSANLTNATVGRVIARYAEFAAFATANRLACVIVPGFALPATRSRVDVGSVLDTSVFSRAFGNATLLPSSQWLHPGARRIKFMRRHHRLMVAPQLPLARPLDSAVRSALSRLGPDFTCIKDPHRLPDEVASLTLRNGIDGWITALRQHYGIDTHHTLLLTGAWKAVRWTDVGASTANVLTLADVAGHNNLTPTLASTHANLLHDPAWADIVEGVVCGRHAASIVDAQPAFPLLMSLDTVIDTMLPHIPSSVLRRDLETLRLWRQRSNRLKKSRPPIAAVAPPSHSALPTLHTLADIQTSRPVVLPFTTQGWPKSAYALPNILPPSVLPLALPRLAPVLARHGMLSPTLDPQSTVLAAQYRVECALIKRWAHRWARAVVWTTPSTTTLTGVLDAVRVVPAGDSVLVVV